jgi:hypothetical protein
MIGHTACHLFSLRYWLCMQPTNWHSLFYKKEIAQLSAMVFASSQALFLITHDVRCDTMLMGWVALSLWQMAAWYQTGKWKHFFVAFIAIACGMMTKGPDRFTGSCIFFCAAFYFEKGMETIVSLGIYCWCSDHRHHAGTYEHWAVPAV